MDAHVHVHVSAYCRYGSGLANIIIAAKTWYSHSALFWQVCGTVGISGMAGHGGGVWTACQCGGPR